MEVFPVEGVVLQWTDSVTAAPCTEWLSLCSTKRTVRVCLWGNMRKVAAASSSHEGHLTRTCFFLPPNPTQPVLCPLPSFPLLRHTFHALVLFSVRGAPEPRLSGKHFHWLLCWVLPTVMQSAPPCTAKSAQRLQNS